MASLMAAALPVFVVLVVGKAVADCVPAVCPTIKCAYGLQRDENGCEVCACNPDCVPVVCPTLKCAYGFQRDVNGCEVCACNPRPECPLVTCRACANGYFYVDGCLTCTCK